MESRLSRGGQLRTISVCVVASIVGLALAVAPAQAKAASPVLEFVSASAFPIDFTADGGEVTAVMAGFETEVNCAGSEGNGDVIGPRSTLSEYVFSGCEATTGSETGTPCSSEGATAGVIETGTIEADLVFIDQATHEVGMLLNPSGGIYMNFKCGGGEAVKAFGPFLAPVDPINKLTTSFTASLSSSGATQVPTEYENAIGEKRQAIPMGEREGHPAATTGVDLSFAITTSAPLEIKAITAAEIESTQREEEAAITRRREDAEAAAAAAEQRRQEEEAKAERLKRTRLLSQGLTRCRKKVHSKHQRVRCETKVKRKFGDRDSA